MLRPARAGSRPEWKSAPRACAPRGRLRGRYRV